MRFSDAFAAASFIGLFALPPAVMAVWPSDGGSVVVLGSKDPLATVAEAGGLFVSSADADRRVVTRAPDRSSKGFVARLFRAGAGAVLASPDAVGCTAVPSRSFSSTHGPKE